VEELVDISKQQLHLISMTTRQRMR